MQVKKKYLTLHSRLRKTPNTATPGAVVQLVRIRAWHARGRGFEPHPHRKNASHICEGHFSYGIVCSWAKAGTCVVREPGSAASCKLKRFPRTTNPKFAMTCVNRAFLLTGKILTTGLVASKRHFLFRQAQRGWSLWLPCKDSELELYYVNSNRRREPCKDLPMPDFRGSWPWTSGNPGLSS